MMGVHRQSLGHDNITKFLVYFRVSVTGANKTDTVPLWDRIVFTSTTKQKYYDVLILMNRVSYGFGNDGRGNGFGADDVKATNTFSMKDTFWFTFFRANSFLFFFKLAIHVGRSKMGSQNLFYPIDIDSHQFATFYVNMLMKKKHARICLLAIPVYFPHSTAKLISTTYLSAAASRWMFASLFASPSYKIVNSLRETLASAEHPIHSVTPFFIPIKN